MSKIMMNDNIGYVEYVSHSGSNEFISEVSGISHESKGPGVEKLIDWGHMSPFEFANITFRIKCPIFVARQLFRHRTGHYMEKSLRYCEALPEFYIPDNEKKNCYEMAYQASWDWYEYLLMNNVKKEQARMVLPMATYTEYFFQIDMRNFLHLISLRVDEHAQGETQAYARAMMQIADVYFPNIAKKYLNGK